MRTVKILQNQNRIFSEISSDVSYPKQGSDFSMRMVFSGNENYTIGTRNLKIYPDSFLVLNEGTSFSRRIYSDVPVHTLSVSFAPQFLKDFHRSQRSSDRTLLDDPFATWQNDVPNFLETLYPLSGDLKFNMLHLKKHIENNVDNDMLYNEYMHHSLALYYRVYNQEVVQKSKKLDFLNSQTKIEILKRLAIAKDYILSNYNRPISLADISQQACLSVNHLLRTFKQAFSCSPHQYLIKVRLQRAQYLLKNSTNSVNEIVDLVGFECPSSFIRLFKGTYNMTPGNYRVAN
ncbi:helix-turn-helix domain-containing protein [Hufsiella ginkgonis]|nr:AraC family transcriptional regulator [Hufsiella ginkgonis]